MKQLGRMFAAYVSINLRIFPSVHAMWISSPFGFENLMVRADESQGRRKFFGAKR